MDEEQKKRIVEDAREWGARHDSGGQKERENGPSLKDTLTEFFKRFGAFVLVFLLLYIYGIHQGLLFRDTPDDLVLGDDRYTPHASVMGSPIIELPVYVYLLREEGAGAGRVDFERIVHNASEIWDQANIDFTVVGSEEVVRSRTEIAAFIGRPTESIRSLQGARRDVINIFVTPALGGINGVAFRGLNSVAVAEYTTSFDFRVLAHEFGHILDLGHTEAAGDLLMKQGGSGARLSEEEIRAARNAAERLR